MSLTHFKPSRIFVDQAVKDLPATIRILKKFPAVPFEILSEPKVLKKPVDLTTAKRKLLLTRLKADPLKRFQDHYSLDLISNCPLDCTYCILQSYLANNPLLTIFTNVEEILNRLEGQVGLLPVGSVIGTGRIADSLALDEIAEHNRFLVPFFGRLTKRARQVGAYRDTPLLELKTKSNQVEGLIGLDHRGRTVVSWSLNPPAIIRREEFKTASLEERFQAAERVSKEGYPVGFHFDPMILHEGWREAYAGLVEKIFKKVPAEKVAWVSIGTLRFPARQGRVMRRRFPKNRSIHTGLISTHRTSLHYPEGLREEMQSFVESRLACHLPPQRIFRCMVF